MVGRLFFMCLCLYVIRQYDNPNLKHGVNMFSTLIRKNMLVGWLICGLTSRQQIRSYRKKGVCSKINNSSAIPTCM